MAWVATHTFVTGEVVSSGAMNEISGNLDALHVSMLPAGAITAYGSSTVPANWLACNGAAVLKSVWPALFSAIGTQWGSGNGSTTFNVPDLQGRAPIGTGTAVSQPTFRNLGDLGGVESVTLSAAQGPVHGHGVTDPQHNHEAGADGNVFAVSIGSGNDGVVSVGTAGRTNLITYTSVHPSGSNLSINNSTPGGSSHENMMPYVAVSYIIKAV